MLCVLFIEVNRGNYKMKVTNVATTNNKKKGNYTILFVIAMFLFPIIIKAILHIIEKGFVPPKNILFSVFSIVQSSLSFYATAFSFSFAVYSFNRQQEKIENDRIEEQQKLENQRREDEVQREEIRKKELEQENKIRLREIESKRDFYRPTFIIDNEGVRLLMRDSNLFLEAIRYFPITEFGTGSKEWIGVKKSGEILREKYGKQFYILAETIIGEKIIFGYLNGHIKVYKYLIDGQNPLYPTGGSSIVNANTIWGSYNSSDNYDSLIEKIFYLNSVGARESFVFSNSEAIKKILNYTTLESYYRGVFQEILEELESGTYTQRSVVRTCQNILEFIRGNHLADIEVHHNQINYKYLHDTVENRLSCYISDYEDVFGNLDNRESLANVVSHVLEYLKRYEENHYILGQILRILAEIFENISFKTTSSGKQNQLDYLISMTFNTLEFE